MGRREGVKRAPGGLELVLVHQVERQHRLPASVIQGGEGGFASLSSPGFVSLRGQPLLRFEAEMSTFRSGFETLNVARPVLLSP